MTGGTNNHLRALGELAERLSARGITIFEHWYSYEGFGSYTLVIGRGRSRLRFNWDGKDRWLRCCSTETAHSGIPTDWGKPKSVAYEGIGVLEGIEAAVNERFAT